MFEGEGTIYKETASGRWRLAIQSTDEDVVRMFYNIVGIGSMTGPFRRIGVKPFWTWRCGTQQDVVSLLSIFMPHLGTRRLAKALECVGDMVCL
jgi:hypothetical protein